MGLAPQDRLARMNLSGSLLGRALVAWAAALVLLGVLIVRTDHLVANEPSAAETPKLQLATFALG